MIDDYIDVKTLKHTVPGCPKVFEGFTKSGRQITIKERRGIVRILIHPNKNTEELDQYKWDSGNGVLSYVELGEAVKTTGLISEDQIEMWDNLIQSSLETE